MQEIERCDRCGAVLYQDRQQQWDRQQQQPQQQGANQPADGRQKQQQQQQQQQMQQRDWVSPYEATRCGQCERFIKT